MLESTAGPRKSKTVVQQQTDYIVNDLLSSMKNNKMDRLFDSINANNEQQNFYDKYINNGQLNQQGIQLAEQLENTIINWLNQKYQANIDINNMHALISLMRKESNKFISALNINSTDYDSYFDDDFSSFISLAVTYLYNKSKSTIKELIAANSKPAYKYSDEDVDTIKATIISWYKSNLPTIINEYIKGNKKFNVRNFVTKYWQNPERLKTIYNILIIDPVQYTSDLKDTIKKLINNAINKAFQEYSFPTALTNNKYAELAKKVINIIEDNYQEIIPYIKFPKERGGAYTHSWLGMGDTRKDALPIFQYLSQNSGYADIILKKINTSVAEITQTVGLPWKDFLIQAYEDNYHENFQLKIRQILVERNVPIHEKRGDELINNGDKKGEDTTIAMSPRKDQNRSGPILVIREYNGDNYKDHVLFGAEGSNHNSIYTDPQYEHIIENCYPYNDTQKHHPTLVHVYRLGKVAFIAQPGQEYNGYRNIDLVAKILIQDLNIEKVYTLPLNKNTGGKITRLEKLIMTKAKYFNQLKKGTILI